MTEQAPYRLQRKPAGRKFMCLASEALAVCLVGFNWLATQRAAAALHYPGSLNGRMAAHIYQPFAWWWWQYRWPQSALQIGRHVILLAPMWRACEHQVIYPMLALGLAAGLCGAALMTRRPPADLHGSATWADKAEMKRAGLL